MVMVVFDARCNGSGLFIPQFERQAHKESRTCPESPTRRLPDGITFSIQLGLDNADTLGVRSSRIFLMVLRGREFTREG
jgi:hypothetical protein